MQALGSRQRYGPQRQWRFLKKKLAWQREASPAISISRRLEMWREGFREASYTLYDLRTASLGDYLPDSSRLDAFFINSDAARNILNDKLMFNALLKDHLPVPAVLGLVQRGAFFALGERETLLSLVARQGQLILKPASGSRGVGIYRVSAGSGLLLNGKPTTEVELQTLISTLDNYLAVEFAEQAAYARNICAESTNTIRLLTLMDPDTQEPFVACAVHRFGTPATAPVDGWSRGGLVSRCDLELGLIGPGVRKVDIQRGELKWHTHHPDTGALLEGVRIQHWERICEGLVAAVRAFPFLTYVGWDVVATDDGFRVIEGNSNTDVEVQLGGGILSQPRVRRFYEYHKIV